MFNSARFTCNFKERRTQERRSLRISFLDAPPSIDSSCARPIITLKLGKPFMWPKKRGKKYINTVHNRKHGEAKRVGHKLTNQQTNPGLSVFLPISSTNAQTRFAYILVNKCLLCSADFRKDLLPTNAQNTVILILIDQLNPMSTFLGLPLKCRQSEKWKEPAGRGGHALSYSNFGKQSSNIAQKQIQTHIEAVPIVRNGRGEGETSLIKYLKWRARHENERPSPGIQWADANGNLLYATHYKFCVCAYLRVRVWWDRSRWFPARTALQDIPSTGKFNHRTKK